jgi:16S rRNA (adenine1518-N6/adenine1519-N6)-dimethyltransferase
MEVRAKKYLGQHFLKDENIAAQIADSLTGSVPHVLEIGPGMGVMTKYLLDKPELDFHAIEIDRESVDYLHTHYPSLHVIEGDFLQLDLSTLFPNPFAVIGNFPYNISSQILFRVYDNRNRIPELVGMFQKEVAERVCAAPGSKTYGILSVLLSAFYDIEYLFTVHEHVFNPPPKVKSAVIRMRRNSVANLDCDEQLFTKVVKIGFNQRRKTLRNALKQLNLPLDGIDPSLLSLRAEQLSVADFVAITRVLQCASSPINPSVV